MRGSTLPAGGAGPASVATACRPAAVSASSSTRAVKPLRRGATSDSARSGGSVPRAQLPWRSTSARPWVVSGSTNSIATLLPQPSNWWRRCGMTTAPVNSAQAGASALRIRKRPAMARATWIAWWACGRPGPASRPIQRLPPFHSSTRPMPETGRRGRFVGSRVCVCPAKVVGLRAAVVRALRDRRRAGREHAQG